MSHPPSHALDALAAGDANADVEAHVASCDACRAYVAEGREGAAAFREKARGADFAGEIARRSEIAKALENKPREGSAAARARRLWFAVPLVAAAAAVVLFVGNRETITPPHESAEESATTRFKGDVPVVVIRDRGGKQTRLTGPFALRAGDRIRIEISVDHPRPLAAGLLGADGTWVPLLEPTLLEAGTTVPELTAAADEGKTDATLIVGAPDAVERAKKSGNFAGLTAWHVTNEP
jgi:hypothetical protein